MFFFLQELFHDLQIKSISYYSRMCVPVHSSIPIFLISVSSSTDLINNMMIHSVTHRINFSLKHLSGTSRYHLHNFLQISPKVQIKKTYLFSMVQFNMQ